MTPRHTALLLVASLLLIGGAAFVLTDGDGNQNAPPSAVQAAAETADQPKTGTLRQGSAGITRSSADLTATEAEGEAEQAAAAAGLVDNTALALRGRVVDQAGAPVAGAEVAAFARIDPRAFFERAGGRRGRSSFDFGSVDFRSMMAQKPLADPVRTARDGSFELDSELARQSSIQLRVTHDAFAPSVVSENFNADRDGAELQVADVVLGGGITVVGVVVDDRGNAIPGAEVRVEPNGNERGGRRGGRGGPPGGFGRMFGGSNELADMVGVVTTDGVGAFTLTRVPAGNFRVRAEARAHLPATSDNKDGDHGSTVDVGVLQLGEGAVLTGIVVDATGAPVADARVEATISRDAMNERMRAVREAPDGEAIDRDALRQQMTMLWRARQDTTTDEEGRFELDQIPAADVRLEISHPEHVDHEQEPVQPLATPDLRIQLGDLLRITGLVVDASTGAPVETFGIRARRIRDRGGFGDFGGRAGPARGGRGGDRGGDRGGARPTPTDPEAVQRDIERETRRAEAEARREREDAFRQQLLGGTGMIPGRTPDPSNYPGGEFSLDDLQPGDYSLDIDAPGFVKVAAARVTLEPGQQAPQVQISLERGVRVVGTLRDAGTGDPVVGARVSLRVPQLEEGGGAANVFSVFGGGGGRGGFRAAFGGGGRGMALQAARTDANGAFELAPQRPGRYELVVEAEDYPEYVDSNFSLPGNTAEHSVALRLDPGGTVFGAVYGLEEGERARVVFAHAESGERNTTDVDRRTGEYRIAGLASGGYRVTVEVRGEGGRNDWRQRIGQALAASMAGSEPDVFVAGNGEQRHDIGEDALELPSVRGLVFRNGAPGEGLEVRLSLANDGSQPDDARRIAGRLTRLLSDRVDGESGEFSIEGVPAGNYTLEVHAGRGGRGGRGGGQALHSEPIVVVRGRDTERTIDVMTGSLKLSLTDGDSQAVGDAGWLEFVKAGEAAGSTADGWRSLPSYQRVRVRGGSLDIEDAPAGTWSYQVRVSGYETLTGELVISAGGSFEQVLQLQKNP